MNYKLIDSHAHLDGEEYSADRDAMMQRAREAGVSKVLIPSIDLPSVERVLTLCAQYPGFAYPMIGLHPEEVKADWKEVLGQMKTLLVESGEQRVESGEWRVESLLPRQSQERDALRTESDDHAPITTAVANSPLSTLNSPLIAVGEVGLDYYWSREYEKEQLAAFDEQVQWSIETRLPLMIHCRKGQNEMVHLLRQYERELPGGVFHCFTGNEREAADFLQFDRFVLGIGGVLTFKKSHLPEVLPAAVPLERIVLETDSPYMAPVPMRGKRNESAYVVYVLQKLAECYGVSEETVAAVTNQNVSRIFGI